MTIRRSRLAVSGSRCSSSEGKSSGCRPIQSPTYRLGGSLTLAPVWDQDKSEISFRDKAVIQRRHVRIRCKNSSSCHYTSKNNTNIYRSFLNRSTPEILQKAHRDKAFSDQCD